jgi:hypothetical protein
MSCLETIAMDTLVTAYCLFTISLALVARSQCICNVSFPQQTPHLLTVASQADCDVFVSGTNVCLLFLCSGCNAITNKIQGNTIM